MAAVALPDGPEARRNRPCASGRTIVQDRPHIESYYGPGALRDVFINVAVQMGKWSLRKTESCRCALAETK